MRRRTDHTIHLAWGHRLRALRKVRGWTLKDCGDRIGMSQATISRVELAQLVPTDALRLLFAALYEMSVYELFAYELSDDEVRLAETAA